MEIKRNSANESLLFGKWRLFHLETNGLTLDVSQFSVTNHGFSKQPMMEAIVYCPVDRLSDAWIMWQKASLVITKGLTKQFFHGIIVFESAVLPSNAPKGYIASKIRLASEFWWLANAHTHCTVHQKNISEFIDTAIKASGLPSSQFTKHHLPNEQKTLRMASGLRWVDFINTQLSQSNVVTRSLFNSTHETIEFIGNINKAFAAEKEPRQILSIAKCDVTHQMHNVYYHFSEKNQRIKGKSMTHYELTMPDARAYPGEWLQLGRDLYQVSNVNICGKHAYTFDNGVASRIAEPELTSIIEIRKPSCPFSFEKKEPVSPGFSVHTGHIETATADNEAIERDEQGHYSARFDDDAPTGQRHSAQLNKQFCAKPGKALNHLRNASLMGGENHTADFPLRDGAEVVLLKTNNADEPVIILGALNNQKSQPVAKKNTSVLRTASGNQLTFLDVSDDEVLALETYKQHNSLRFEKKANTIFLTSKEGSIKLDASNDFITHTPATIHLHATKNLTEFVKEDINLDSFGGRIKFNIKNRAYLSALESYKIEVRNVMITSLENITIKADDIVDINCEELTITANKGRVEIDAAIININADEITTETPSSNMNISEKNLMIRGNAAVIDIKQAAHNAKQSFLGGTPKPADNTPEVITIKKEKEDKPKTKPDIIKDELKQKPKGANERSETLPPKEAISPALQELNRNEFSLSGMIKKTQAIQKDGSLKFELKKDIKLEHTDKNPCWKVTHKTLITLKASAVIKPNDADIIRRSLNKGDLLKSKLEDLVVDTVCGDTKMTLKQTGELTLKTSIPSLKGYKFDLKLGLDEETGMPYAGASVSYDFYDYVLKIKNGAVKLNGNLTVANTFTPVIDGALCKALVEADKATNFVTNHKEEVATLLLGTAAIAEAKLLYAAAAGILTTSTVVEAKSSKIYSQQYINAEGSLIVKFDANELRS